MFPCGIRQIRASLSDKHVFPCSIRWTGTSLSVKDMFPCSIIWTGTYLSNKHMFHCSIRQTSLSLGPLCQTNIFPCSIRQIGTSLSNKHVSLQHLTIHTLYAITSVMIHILINQYYSMNVCCVIWQKCLDIIVNTESTQMVTVLNKTYIIT